MAMQTESPRKGLMTDLGARVIFWIAFFLLAIYLFAKDYELANSTEFLESNQIDFISFWAAAKLFLAGDGLAAFDLERLTAAGDFPPDQVGSFFWHYPPGVMLLSTPLGFFPFWAAWNLFILASLICLYLAVRAPTAGLAGGWRLTLAAPVVLVGCLAIGQTSVFWTAGLVGALWAMREGRAVRAGFLIALLTLKPQLGILIPLALVAAWQWRVIFWASVFTIAIAVITTLPFGLTYWEHFAEDIRGTLTRMSEDFVLPPFVSFYGFLRIFGADHGTGILAQGLMTALLAGIVLWIWSRGQVSDDLKCAILCAAIPLASPYAYYYEMVLTLAAGLFLMRDGFGQTWPARLWLVVIWFGPVIPLYLPSYASVAGVAPLMIMVTITICFCRQFSQNPETRKEFNEVD